MTKHISCSISIKVFFVILAIMSGFILSCGSSPSQPGNTTQAPSSNDITAFGIKNPAVTGVISGTDITVNVPYGTDRSNLVAVFTTTGAQTLIGSVIQESGVTVNNFNTTVIYTVISSDGSKKNYTVTVNTGEADSKQITSFSLGSFQGIIEGTLITVSVPYGFPVNPGIAAFSTNGKSVSVNGAVQTSGVTANNFSGDLIYRVSASDNSYLDYTVRVTVREKPVIRTYTWDNTHTDSDLYPYARSVYAEGDNIYVATPAAGLAISHDKGATWWYSTTSNGLDKNDIFKVTKLNNTLFVSTVNNFYSSDDEGVTWNLSYSVAALPLRPVVIGSTIYLLSNGRYHVSDDGGRNWTTITPPSPLSTATSGYMFNHIFITDGATYLATSKGLYRATDPSGTWSQISPEGFFCNSVHVEGTSIYLATQDGFRFNSTGGSTNSTNWRVIADAEHARTASQEMYDMVVKNGRIYICGQLNFAWSDDTGKTWHPYYPGRADVSTFDQITNEVNDIFFDGDTIYLATIYGLSISDDGCATWERRESRNCLGIDVKDICKHDSTLYIATGSGLSTSGDDGLTWNHMTVASGLSQRGINRINYVDGLFYLSFGQYSYPLISADDCETFQPSGINYYYLGEMCKAGQSLYASFDYQGFGVLTDGVWTIHNDSHGLPASTVYGFHITGDRKYLGTNAGLCYRPLTDSSSWITRTTSDGLGSNSVCDVFVENSIIYAATSGGLSISTNGGLTWTNKNTSSGLPVSNVTKIKIINNVIYLASKTGLVISYDGGSTWTKFSDADGLPGNDIYSFFVDGYTIYIATEGGLSVMTF